MDFSARHTWLTPVLAYLAAALFLAFLSYRLPRMLPGDFVTAMYGSSDVVLTVQQEADLRIRYQEDSGFTAFLGRLFRLDWGFSQAFQAPVSSLFSARFPGRCCLWERPIFCRHCWDLFWGWKRLGAGEPGRKKPGWGS